MLPNPDNYASWQDWARAVNREIEDTGLTSGGPLLIGGGSSSGGSASSITMPDGYKMVWLSQTAGDLFLGNNDFDPPNAADLFQIDTKKIADAAIATRNLGPEAVTAANIKTATIGTAQIGDAVIVTALIGEAQIVTSKIGDLAVNNAKIADLAVNSAKIANLSVGNQHVIDAAIVNAKIGNLIQSYGYDGVNGWQIAKDGSIRGTSITILNPDGSVAFASGTKIDLGTQVTGFLDRSQTTGFGSMAALNLLTQGNITTYIEGAAIVRALIANAAIGTANIDAAAITTALIANAAIISAHIQDAAITNAKIANLSFDKMTAGTLNARIDMGSGLIVFNVGASQLILGAGFGQGAQFVMWFGSSGIDPQNVDAQSATFYLDRNGNGYYGGALSQGKTTNRGNTTVLAADTYQLGPFTSAGRAMVVLPSVGFTAYLGGGSIYEGDLYQGNPAEPDPFVNQRQTWRQIINVQSSQGQLLASNAQDFGSRSTWERIGSTGGSEPQGRYRWQHRIGGTQSRTINTNLGAGDGRTVTVNRESLVNLADGQSVRGLIGGNSLGVSTVED